MNEYLQIVFSDLLPGKKEILIAQLAEVGYEGFEETLNGLDAFILSNDFNKLLLEEISLKHEVEFTEKEVKTTNWNQVWESNFEPVIVNDFVSIRADFHLPVKSIQHEIIITPKMSFGTGHHATTHMMIEQMQEIDFVNKNVFDFGTGTGVLAILAEKLGAKNIIAVDIDDWSIENANENIIRNHCKNIKIRKAFNPDDENKSDIILANINRNVILENFYSFRQQLNHPGVLLISGILEEDINDIITSALSNGFNILKKLIRNNWVSFSFTN